MEFTTVGKFNFIANPDSFDNELFFLQDKDSWWDVSYNFRTPIIIMNRDSSPLPKGYSINLSLNTINLISTGRLRIDGKDLRIVWYNSSNDSWLELDRINVTRFNIIDTQIWFKTQISIDPGENDDNYYLYYGYADANNPPSNKNEIYDFYDDFTQPDGPAEGWTNTSGSSWTVINNEYRENEGQLNRRSILDTYTFENVSIEIDVRCTGGLFNYGLIFRYSDEGNFYHTLDTIWMNHILNTHWILKYFDNAHSILNSTDEEITLIDDKWYNLRIDALGPRYQVYIDGVLKLTATDIDHITPGQIGLMTWTTNAITYFDNLKIRLLVAEAPKIDLGIEETRSTQFNYIVESADPLELGNSEIITVNITDLVDIMQVFIEINGVNHSMTHIGGDLWRYGSWVPLNTGVHIYKIYSQNIDLKWSSITGSIQVIDTIPPSYSDLIKSADPLELGATEIISIHVYDISGINQILIEIEDINYTMTNIEGDTWQYDAWTPSSTGAFSYTIYMEDMNNNWNLVFESITVVDTTPPSYSDLMESADPLELGTIEIFNINVDDISGINQVLIEIEGVNYTMVNIGGVTWQYDTWTPSSTGTYFYTIYMEDMNKNWISVSESIEVVDNAPPSYSDLMESADPLELGITEIISINVYDISGINQVLIEIEGINYTMVNIGGETWQYDTWTPSSTGIYLYTIRMVDITGNWNSVSGSIRVVDTTPPLYSDLIESADPLELGATELISIHVYDISGINQVLIEIEGINYTMVNIGGENWQYNTWTPSSTGTYPYTIFMEDLNGNWKTVSDSIEVVDNAPPSYSNLIESADPLELGVTELISINVYDSSGVNQVLIEIEGTNYTMVNIGGENWQYNTWTPSNTGTYPYTIYMEDLNGNWNSVSGSIRVVDTTPPLYSDLIESADPLELGATELININVYDISGINQVLIEIEGINYTMVNIGGDTWQYDTWTPSSTGIYSYIIHMEDIDNNWNTVAGSITVVDNAPPSYSDLVESADPLELGDSELISINVYDIIGISQVLIEIEGINYTMTNIGGNTWQHDAWTPSSTGIYSYTIYMEDIDNNWNSVSGSIQVIDSTPPSYSDLTESADPLELGSTEIIIIDMFDISGINQVLIEIEGTNYTMVNIGGETWQYDDWTPSFTGTYSYTVYMEDMNGNWKSVSESIEVIDTTPPEIIIYKPDPYDLIGITVPEINIEFIDYNLDFTWYQLIGIISTGNYTWTGTLNQTLWDQFDSGWVTIKFYAIDLWGNLGSASITVKKDITAPEILIIEPNPYDLFGKIVPSVDIEVEDQNLDTIWYKLFNSTLSIIDYSWIGSIRQSKWDEFNSGILTIRFYANDTLGNTRFLDITILKDISPPDLIFYKPNPYDLCGVTPPNIDIYVFDDNLDNVWYQLSNGLETTENYTWGGNISQDVWDELGNGTVKIFFYANDTLSNFASQSMIIRKDIIAPFIFINYPPNSTIYGNIPPSIGLNVDEPNLDNTWYQINNGTLTTGNYSWMGIIEQNVWDELGNGTLTIIFYSNDTVGNLGSKILVVRKDIIAPKIVIEKPSANDLFGESPPIVDVEFYDPHLSHIWYQLKNGTIVTINYTWTGLIEQSIWNLFGNGSIIIIFYANDSLGNLGIESLQIHKDVIAPRIIFDYPNPYEVFGKIAPNINVIINDKNINNIWYQLKNESFITLNHTWTGTLDQTVWDELGNGTVTVRFYASDLMGNLGYAEITILKDVSAPIINIIEPENFGVFGQTAPEFKVYISGVDIHNCWYALVGNKYFFTRSDGITIVSIDQTKWEEFGNGTLTIVFYVNDSVGNIGFDIIKLRKDLFAPKVKINLPIYEVFWNKPPILNISFFDPNYDSLWYRIGNTNVILINNTEQTLDPILWNNLEQGEFHLYIFANDTAGNINNTYSYTLFKDTFAPSININLPLNNTYSNVPPTFNITCNDPNFDTLWYSDGKNSISLTNNTVHLLDWTIWNSLPDGKYQILIYANDTFGHLNNHFILTLYKDTNAPEITIYSLINNTINNHPPILDIYAFDPNLDTLWYQIGGFSGVLQNHIEQEIDQLAWDLLPQGEFQLYIFANDSFGYLNNSLTFTLYKDTLAPRIIINFPNNQTYWNSRPIINITVYDPNLDKIWYKIGTIYSWLENNTETLITDYIWSNLLDGQFIIQIYASDYLGQINDTYKLILYKDTSAPEISIYSPINITLYNHPPILDVYAIDPNLDTLWYQIGGFSGVLQNHIEQEIDQLAWDLLPQGEFILYIYANDSFGHLNNSLTFTLYKDTLAPHITINLPIEYQEVGAIAPYFNITITDENLDTLWYTLDGGLTNTTFRSNIKQINQELWSSIWKSKSNGDLISIMFYANDTLGQIGYQDVIIMINKPFNSSELTNLTGFIFIGTLGVIFGITTITIKTSKKFKRMDQKQKKKVNSIFYLALTLISLLLLSFVI